MSGSLAFMDRYRNEAACLAALAGLRWPAGFVCAGCSGRAAYQLATRRRVLECADCGRQHSVTAGTVFHRTRTPLRKWFAAACWMAQDKPGARIFTDAFKSYHGLADGFRHHPIVQDGGKNADAVLPIVHVLFSNLKTWINGIFHGVSKSTCRAMPASGTTASTAAAASADLAGFLLRRAATRSTITYRQLMDGGQPTGALPALTG